MPNYKVDLWNLLLKKMPLWFFVGRVCFLFEYFTPVNFFWSNIILLQILHLLSSFYVPILFFQNNLLLV